MPFSITSAAGRVVLKLEGAVTIRHAQDLAARLGESLEDSTPLVVDTGGLEDIDTCILQMLYSLRRRPAPLAFDNPSETFLSAADRCGLRRELLVMPELS